MALTFVSAVGEGRDGSGKLLADSVGSLSGEKIAPVCRGWGPRQNHEGGEVSSDSFIGSAILGSAKPLTKAT